MQRARYGASTGLADAADAWARIVVQSVASRPSASPAARRRVRRGSALGDVARRGSALGDVVRRGSALGDGVRRGSALGDVSAEATAARQRLAHTRLIVSRLPEA